MFEKGPKMKLGFLFIFLGTLSGCSDGVIFGGNIALAVMPIVMLLMTINFKKF